MTKDDPIIEPGEDPSVQIAEALADLVEVAPADRDAWLRARFPDDDFRAELLSLVTHLDSSASNTSVKEDPLTQDADPWIDRLVVGCRIIRLIGSGGMGRVYEARQVGTGRLVAIKLLDQSMASQFLAERLRAEGAALGALKHPNIAHVYQAGIVTADGRTEPYIVMELVRDALDVRQWSTQGSLDARQRLERLAICCDAIHYGHRQGIIHGDIKPANVLFDAEDRPRIIDFGTSRLRDAVDSRNAVTEPIRATTPNFSAPEILASPWSKADTRSDVYGLGRLVQEVADSDGFSALTARQRHDLQAVMECATSQVPDARHESAAALANDLRAIADDRPVSARRSGFVEQARRFVRRRPVASMMACLAVVALIVAFGLIIAAERRARHSLALAELSQAARAVQRGDLAEALARLQVVRELGTVEPVVIGMLERRTDQSIADFSAPGSGHCMSAQRIPGTTEFAVASGHGVYLSDTAQHADAERHWLMTDHAANGVAISDDGVWAWIAAQDGTLLRYELRSKGVLPLAMQPLAGVGIESIAPTETGGVVLGMDNGSVLSVDRDAGIPVVRIPALNAPAGFGTFVVRGPRGTVLAGLADGRLMLIPDDSKIPPTSVFEYGASVTELAWNSDTGTAAIGYRDGHLSIVDLAGTHPTVQRDFPNAIWGLAFSAGGAMVAIGDRAGIVTVCESHTLRTVSERSAGTFEPVWWLEFDSDGQTLLAMAGVRFVRLPIKVDYPYTIAAAEQSRGLRVIKDDVALIWTAGGHVQRIDLRTGRELSIEKVPVRRNMRGLTVGPRTGKYAVIDGDELLIDGKCIADFKVSGATWIAMAWALDESKLWFLDGSHLSVFASTGVLLHSFELGQGLEVPSLAPRNSNEVAIVSGRGTWVADCGSSGFTVRKVDVTGFKSWAMADGLAIAEPNGALNWRPWPIQASTGVVKRFVGHTDIVRAADLNQQHGLLATGGSEGKVRIWDFSTGEQLVCLEGHQSSIARVQWFHDGHALATLDSTGLIQVWTDLPPSSLDLPSTSAPQLP